MPKLNESNVIALLHKNNTKEITSQDLFAALQKQGWSVKECISVILRMLNKGQLETGRDMQLCLNLGADYS